MDEPFQNPPDLYWAPVRHHSPQCAWQLRRLIESLRPQRILVEGPSEAQHLMPYLQEKLTRPPVAVYLYAQGSAKAGASSGHFRAFIPFAAMSPEWVALRSAGDLDIPVEFIDLPYRRRLNLSAEPQAHQRAEEKLLNDDALIAHSRPMAWLLAETGCRDFDEWWERHFESGVHHDDPVAFFTQLRRFGLLLRQGDGQQDQETLAREAWMADQIRPHLAAGERCLVICGAYHCAGISQFLDQPAPAPGDPGSFDGGVHLVPYSLKRLNRAAGYGAGMPDSGYYHALWRKLSRRKKSNTQAHEVHAEITVALTEQLRGQGYAVTLPDAVEVNLMARRLAELRGCASGRLELRDALESCCLKQAHDGSELGFRRHVDRFLAGSATGALPDRVPVSPLVEDFRRLGRQYRWPLSASEARERALDIYRRAGHREQSRRLHQLAFLGVPYGEFIAGPRFSAGDDLTRVREIWQLSWQPESEARLTECSHYGSSLADAALHALLERLADPSGRGAGQVALLIEALAMGLHDVLEPVLAAVEDWLHQETELLPLCEGLQQLSLAYFIRGVLAGKGLPTLKQTLNHCFERICVRLPWAGQLDETQSDALCDALAGMHGQVVGDLPGCTPMLFHDALEETLKYTHLAQLKGVACAILWVVERMSVPQVAQVFSKAFAEAKRTPEDVGYFLQGFLRVARGRIGYEPELMALITDCFLVWDEEEFIEVLPALRLAFTQLSPRESRDLAHRLVEEDAYQFTQDLPWSAQELALAASLRQELRQLNQRWGSG
jgi:hypothetical protein